MSKKDGISRRDLFRIGGAGAATAFGTALTRSAQAKPKAGAGDDALPQVPRRVLGKTKQTIPILLFGAAVHLDKRFDPKLAEALRFGVNYIDAADCYGGGSCELAVAKFHGRAKVREQLWITSKSDEHDPEGFEKTLATSLRKLDTNYVDMYYLHGLRDADYLNPKLARKVEELKKQGKMRYFGFSCHNSNVVELMNKAAKLPWIDSIMFRYNFRQYGNKQLNRAIDACAKSDIGLIAMKTQGSESSFRDAWKKFESDGKWTKHQAVLKAVWADKRITAAVSAMDNLEKLRQNVAAAIDKHELSQVEWDAIERYAADTRHLSCDGCDEICSSALNAPAQIGDTMRYLMYHDVYDEPEKAKTLFRKLPLAAQNIADVDFSAAEAACPYGVSLASHMKRAAKILA